VVKFSRREFDYKKITWAAAAEPVEAEARPASLRIAAAQALVTSKAI